MKSLSSYYTVSVPFYKNLLVTVPVAIMSTFCQKPYSPCLGIMMPLLSMICRYLLCQHSFCLLPTSCIHFSVLFILPLNLPVFLQIILPPPFLFEFFISYPRPPSPMRRQISPHPFEISDKFVIRSS